MRVEPHHWIANRPRALRVLAGAMVVLGGLKLVDEFGRLLFDPGVHGAIDLRLRDTMVQGWFAGRPIYHDFDFAIFPPASYPLLWPLSGWLGPTASPWFWAVSTLAALALTLHLVVTDCGNAFRGRRWFVALLLLSMNATGVVIGNGQLVLHLIPPLLASVLWLRTEAKSNRRDLWIAACFLFALAKPSIAAPFFWLILFADGGGRAALLVGAGYLGLTLLAVAFQAEGIVELFRGWISNTSGEAGGYAEINSLMHSLGQPEWAPFVSLLLLALWGGWAYRYRRADRWLQLGATALFARFWTYHRVYDDVLVFLAEIALLRVSVGIGRAREKDRQLSELLLITMAVVMLCPARLLEPSTPLSFVFRGGHALVWAAALAFLIACARRETSKLSSVGQGGH